MKYHKSKYSQKNTLNRKTTAKFKKLGMHGAPHKTFGTVGQNFDYRHKIFDTVRQICATSKNFSKFSVLWKNVNFKMVWINLY